MASKVTLNSRFTDHKIPRPYFSEVRFLMSILFWIAHCSIYTWSSKTRYSLDRYLGVRTFHTADKPLLWYNQHKSHTTNTLQSFLQITKWLGTDRRHTFINHHAHVFAFSATWASCSAQYIIEMMEGDIALHLNTHNSDIVNQFFRIYIVQTQRYFKRWKVWTDNNHTCLV